MRTYSSFINLSNQFRFCGNAFRVDMYKGCDFGCQYCFANNSDAAHHENEFLEADIDKLQKLFIKAFETSDKDNLVVELLRHRVPLHCGGMSDPFQTREFKLHLTKQLIELSNKYNYPICFSSKTAKLPDDYWEILNPEIHAFQVSLIGIDENYCKNIELNTPTPMERIEFIRELRNRGFWCSMRIQPCIDIEQACKLVEYVKDLPSYITVEHLKIPQTNLIFFNRHKQYIPNVELYRKSKSKYYELPIRTKMDNLERIKSIANSYGVSVGAGDNELHYLTQGRCCCGIDQIKSFENYLKYNSTYLTTGEYDIENMYMPSSNCTTCLFSDAKNKFPQNNGFISYKEIVDDYLLNTPEHLGSYKDKLHKELFGVNPKKKLF